MSTAPKDDGPTLLCLGNDPELLEAMAAISSLEWGLDGQNNPHQEHHQSVLRAAFRRALFEAEAAKAAIRPHLATSAKTRDLA